MDDKEERIILSALAETAQHPNGTLSAKRLAEKLGMSENALLSSFGSWDAFLNEVRHYITSSFYEAMEQNASTSQSFQGFFSKMVDYLLAHPNHNAFAVDDLRRLAGMPPSALIDYEAEKRAFLARLARYFPLQRAEDAEFLYDRFSRELFSYCQLLIEQALPDGSESRKEMANLLLNGFSLYQK